MKIGIVVFSHTGNTLRAAGALESELLERGHDPEILRLEVPADYKPGEAAVELEGIPDISGCDGLVFASPVHAFSLSAVMREYLGRAEIPPGTRKAALITQHLPFAWLGGNRALRQLEAACGGSLNGGAIVNWSRSNRERQIEEAAAKIAGLF